MKFHFQRLEIPDVILVEHEIFKDERGFFLESYRENDFLEAGIPRMVQDNHSRSTRGVLRGLHFQVEPRPVGKLVRCARGAIFDVAVDIRKGSPTYAKWVGIELSEENRRILYVPPGFAHGILILSDVADVLYKMTDYYSPEHDRSISYRDPDIGIAWPIADPIVSAKDRNAPRLEDSDNNLVYGR